jgi:orotate phosphoribosyltransferase
VRDVVVLIDRRPSPTQQFDVDGVRVHAVVTLRELLDTWLRRGAITDAQFHDVDRYLNGDETQREEA